MSSFDSHWRRYLAGAVSAAESNPDLSTVNLLLDYGADTNATTSIDETLLYIASSVGLTSTVQRLLKCGAKVDVVSEKKSPLIDACRNQDMAAVELLLTEGADPDMPVADRYTNSRYSFALHIAAARQKDELVTLLLNHGASVNIADASGNTALHYAIYCSGRVHINCQKVVDTLLCAGADVNATNSTSVTPLYLSVKYGLLDLVDSMLSRGGNPNVAAGYKNMLCWACHTKNLQLVEMLLKAGADPNPILAVGIGSRVRHELPLFAAVKQGNFEVATLLLNYGANVNMLSSVVHNAILCLVKNGPIRGWLQKLEAAKCMTEWLLKHGADANQLIANGVSLLQALLIGYTTWLPFRYHFLKSQFIHDLVCMLICNGACLAAPSTTLKRGYFDPEQLNVKILERLSGWCPADQILVELLKSGAEFKLLALSCTPNSATGVSQQATSIYLCQAAVMAGYVPSAEDLEELQQSVTLSGDRVGPGRVELLSWLVEDRQQVPSLMRQCRVAIRRQLTVASCHRTILPAIDQLPLSSELQQYLKFEGCLTEIDLSL